jgi:hypothetical protein
MVPIMPRLFGTAGGPSRDMSGGREADRDDHLAQRPAAEGGRDDEEGAGTAAFV